MHTSITCIGVVDALDILQQTSLPFVRTVYPYGHHFMQDNDPKHTSKLEESFLRSNGINWWKTSPKSPDLNPIENLWHKLKRYLRREFKLRNEDELIDGVVQFWNSVSVISAEVHQAPSEGHSSSGRVWWSSNGILHYLCCI